MLQAELGTVVTYNPLSLSVDTTLAEILRLWSTMEFRDWPVVDDQRLVGILSEDDIVRTVSELAVIGPQRERELTAQLSARTARQMMSPSCVSIGRWDLQTNALYQLLKHQMHSLPVVDEERLVGLVTTTDFLREFTYGELPASREQAARCAEETPEPIDCDATLEGAEQAMLAASAELIGVVSGNLTLGVVTRRDVRLAKCRLETRRVLSSEFCLPGPATLREVVAQSPILRPGARLSEAAKLMVEHRRQAVGVVNQAGRLVGVLTEKRILKAMVGHESWQAGNR